MDTRCGPALNMRGGYTIFLLPDYLPQILPTKPCPDAAAGMINPEVIQRDPEPLAYLQRNPLQHDEIHRCGIVRHDIPLIAFIDEMHHKPLIYYLSALAGFCERHTRIHILIL